MASGRSASGGTAIPIATGQANPWYIATDGSVMKCAVAGCGASPTVLAAHQAGASGIAVSGDYVYWTNQDDGTVNRVAK
jgi:hypothetical protein